MKKVELQLSDELFEKLTEKFKTENISLEEGIKQLLSRSVEPTKKNNAKAQHRFLKEFADMEFTVDYEGAKATIIWQKRNEFLIKSGATMVVNPPLNKDGSLGFGARFANTLREEYADAIEGNHTTRDIVLKSVNEVGHFLYFAGTNSWLQLKDKDGRTLDELSRV
jgi:hypothetical protein